MPLDESAFARLPLFALFAQNCLSIVTLFAHWILNSLGRLSIPDQSTRLEAFPRLLGLRLVSFGLTPNLVNRMSYSSSILTLEYGIHGSNMKIMK